MVLIVSIIFLITFAGVCNPPPPDDTSCDWIESGSYSFNGVMKFKYPINPPTGFTSEYRYDPIWGVEPIINSGGFVVVTVIAISKCGEYTNKQKEYPPSDGLSDTDIRLVPIPDNGISSVRTEVYSKKFYFNNEYVRVLWTKSFTDIDGLHNEEFDISTIVTLTEDQYQAQPIYKNGLVDPV